MYTYRRNSTRDRRADQIVGLVERDGLTTLTRAARHMGLKRSPYLQSIFCDLIDGGRLIAKRETTSNGLPVFVYRLPQRTN